MTDSSPILGMPYIQASQAQKHVTHNEALRVLDMLVQPHVIARDVTTPPAAPTVGDRYVVPAGATGVWAGNDGSIAVNEQTGWTFVVPASGWQTYVTGESSSIVFDGTSWVLLKANIAPADLQNLDGVGVNTTSDATNKLAVASDATLFSHNGSDHRLKINKSADPDTASLVFQSGWTGYAEMGLAGDTSFSVKVSDDGVAFTNALSIAPTTGVATFPQGINLGNDNINHYEEGTWIPELTFGGANAGMVYDIHTGQYTRIGNLVFLQCAIDLSIKGSSTGSAEITGLPFSANPSYYPGEVFFIAGAIGLTTPQCRILPGSKIRLVNGTSSGTINLTETNFTDGTNLKISIMHFV